MRKLSLGTWLALAAAVGLAAVVVGGVVRLFRAAPAATRLGARAASSPRRLIVGGPERVIVIEESAAYTIARDGGSLRALPLAWPGELRIDAVKSAAYRNGKLALTAETHDFNHDPDKTWPAVLLVDGDRLARVYTPPGDYVHRAHVSNVAAAEREPEEPKETLFAFYLQEDASLYRVPFWQEVKPGADDERHRLESGFWPGAIERITWRPPEGPIFWGSNQARQIDEHSAPIVPTTALDLFGNIHDEIERPHDPRGLLLRTLDGEQVVAPANEPKVAGGRDARVGGRLIASLPERDEFWLVPLGAAWLALGQERPEALLLDAAGARLDRVARARSIAAITEEPSPAWLGVIGALALGLIALGLIAGHALAAPSLSGAVAAERVAPGARGVFFGTLRIPEGALLETDARGHVQVASGCRVRVGAVDLELGPGLERGDAALDVPLIDGDQVFVIGCVAGDADAGPWRGSGRLRLGADGRHLAIGRGGPGDFAERTMVARNRRVVRLGLAVLALEIALLARFAFAVFG